MFNQALLGKQAFRIWDRPDSLLAQILKHRYFKRCTFLESSVGTRPSYAWRSILHGRDLLIKGLKKVIGDGSTTRVWMDPWIMDTIPRPPNYRPDAVVDLTLRVSDLIDAQTGMWKSAMVRQIFTDEDAALVLKIQRNRLDNDKMVWGFTKDGQYSSKSGYKLLNIIQEMEMPTQPSLPPLERNLWRKLWKTKAPPKLRHFMWKALAGALAVKERLASRGLGNDTTCGLCGRGAETICHVLFTCPNAKETWENSGFPLPRHGFSPSSVLLNPHYLFNMSSKQNIAGNLRLAFPWILWRIWKARNLFIFEKTRLEPSVIGLKALEEAEIWLCTNNVLSRTDIAPVSQDGNTSGWTKPPFSVLKCNIGISWFGPNKTCGSSWILRNHLGETLLHSRRSFSRVSSQMEAELLSLLWAVESMLSLKKNMVIFESSLILAREAMLHPTNHSPLSSLTTLISTLLSRIPIWSLNHTAEWNNRAATLIAKSVTQENMSSSFVARGGPVWLRSTLSCEANAP